MNYDAKTVLVIVNDQQFVATISRTLLDKGLGVVAADDTNEGITLARSVHPDLIIVGLILPRRSGFLLLERLRQWDVVCPAVVVTEIKAERQHEYRDLLGVDEYFLQPFTTSALVQCVSCLLEPLTCEFSGASAWSPATSIGVPAN